MLSELNATCSQKYDFEGNFNNLIKPLLEHELLMEEIEEYLLTDTGEKHLKDFTDRKLIERLLVLQAA